MSWARVQKAVARVCLGHTQVGGARISWMRARKMHAPLEACKLGRVYLLGTRISLIVLLHMKDVGIWGLLLCTLVQCRCGHSSPNDAGVRA